MHFPWSWRITLWQGRSGRFLTAQSSTWGIGLPHPWGCLPSLSTPHTFTVQSTQNAIPHPIFNTPKNFSLKTMCPRQIIAFNDEQSRQQTRPNRHKLQRQTKRFPFFQESIQKKTIPKPIPSISIRRNVRKSAFRVTIRGNLVASDPLYPQPIINFRHFTSTESTTGC